MPTLEFWRILSLKIFKISHDEFLYDESLNSYHNHIYTLMSNECGQAV